MSAWPISTETPEVCPDAYMLNSSFGFRHSDSAPKLSRTTCAVRSLLHWAFNVCSLRRTDVKCGGASSWWCPCSASVSAHSASCSSQFVTTPCSVGHLPWIRARCICGCSSSQNPNRISYDPLSYTRVGMCVGGPEGLCCVYVKMCGYVEMQPSVYSVPCMIQVYRGGPRPCSAISTFEVNL